MNKKKILKSIILIFLMTLFLFIGAIAGFFHGKREGLKNVENYKKEVNIQRKKTILALDLLRSYTNFVFLPQESNLNPQEFAEDLEKKAKIIDDSDILDKFYKTGELENKEQKIAEFLDLLIMKTGESCSLVK